MGTHVRVAVTLTCTFTGGSPYGYKLYFNDGSGEEQTWVNPIPTGQSPGLLSILAAALLMACGAAGPAHVPAEPPGGAPRPLNGLTVHQTVPLNRAAHGLEGRLELLLDARLTHARLEDFWATGETDPAELEPAVLQVMDRGGEVRDRQVLDRPLARFEAERLMLPGDSLWLLTVDYSASSEIGRASCRERVCPYV